MQQGVPTYIVGFVIGTAPLCIAIVSPVTGYFVSVLLLFLQTLCLGEKVLCA